jgi:hypothetical protein
MTAAWAKNRENSPYKISCEWENVTENDPNGEVSMKLMEAKMEPKGVGQVSKRCADVFVTSSLGCAMHS